jgi:hypothetical protein
MKLARVVGIVVACAVIAGAAGYLLLKPAKPGVSAPAGFSQTGQTTEDGLTITTYSGTGTVQDALGKFKTWMQGQGWEYRLENGAIREYRGHLYEKGEMVAVVQATSQAGKVEVVVVSAKKRPKPPPEENVLPEGRVALSGRAYHRAAGRRYLLQEIPSPPLEGVTLQIGDLTSVSGSAGNYGFRDVPAGFRSIFASKDGYITSKVSGSFTADQENLYVGLYQASVVNPRPGFLDGVVLWDAGGWIPRYYPEFFYSTFTKIRDSANAAVVAYVDPFLVKSASTSGIELGTISNKNPDWHVLSSSEYSAIVNDAHEKGLEFMMWFGVTEDGTVREYWDIVRGATPPSSEFWDSWFSEYQSYLVQYAELAENLGVEYISLGHDMNYATGKSRFASEADSLNRWASLINAVRSVYGGKIVYFAGIGYASDPPYYESDDFPAGFVDLLDYLGLGIQACSTQANATLDQLKVGIETILGKYTGFSKPILVMLRTPSVDTGTSIDTYIEPALVVNRISENYAMDLFEQADVYEALFEVINMTPTGNGRVMGVFSWGYNYLDDYHDLPAVRARERAGDVEAIYKADVGWVLPGMLAMDKSANIRGKPAEAVCKYWFERF